MISTILAQQRLKHIAQRIEEREINIDAEYCMYLAEPLKADTAIILGQKYWLDCICNVILIVRNSFPVTIEMRRLSQKTDCKSLGVLNIQKLNLEV